jgi:CRP-like cAMP-binding protein
MENILFDYLSKYITLTADEKKAIIDLNIFKQIKKGTLLLKEGQFSDYGYFVIKGCLRCYYIIDGEEKTTAFYTEAESFEPPCKINKKSSDFFVDCAEDSILIVANSEMEKTMFEKFPKFETLCRVLTEELLVKSKSEFDNFKISSPEERYLNLLETRPNLPQRIPQYQIASYLGITAQSLSRIRNRLLENKK